MSTHYERFTASVAGINRSLQKIETDEMKKYSLKGSYAQFLFTLSQHPEGITAAQLCLICDKDKAAVSRALSELEKKGMLKKEGEVNYRSKLILTKKGKEVSNRVCRRLENAICQAESNINDGEKQVMSDTLDAVAEELRDFCRDGISE